MKCQTYYGTEYQMVLLQRVTHVTRSSSVCVSVMERSSSDLRLVIVLWLISIFFADN